MKVLTLKTSDGCFVLNLQELTNIHVFNTSHLYNLQIMLEHVHMYEFIFQFGDISYGDFQNQVLSITDFLASDANNLVLDFSVLQLAKYYLPRKTI